MASPDKLIFGSYEVLQNPDGTPCILGEGSFGVTYKARHTFLGRISALKVIREDLLNRGSKEDHEEAQRFLGEARAVGRLNHPGIASVYDCALANEVFYYAMEFCDGGTLQDACAKNGPMAWPEVRVLALQLASALDYAHGSGFLHRDIKPANIMLSGEGKSRQAKLIDFGLAKKFEINPDLSSATVRNDEESFRGNFTTASPEQIQEKDLDQRSDLFALGVTLWWLLLGHNPFKDIKSGPLIADRLGPSSYATSLPPDLDAEARVLLETLLEKDVEKRIASAHAVMELLGAAAPSMPDSQLSAMNVPIEPLQVPPDYEDGYSYGPVISNATPAKLYHGKNTITGDPVIAVLPDVSLDPAALGGMRIAGHRKLDFGAYAILDWRFSGQSDVFVLSKPAGCSLLAVLRKFGPARFADALPFLSYLARCFDTSVAWTTFGTRMDPGDILVRARDGGEDLEKFHSWSDLNPHSARCLPRLATDSEHRASSEATLSTSAEEFPPLAQFAALVYRVLAGSSVKYAAFFTTGGYVMASGLSEDGNALISNTICAPEAYPSAARFLQSLAKTEGHQIFELKLLVSPPTASDIESGKLPPLHSVSSMAAMASRRAAAAPVSPVPPASVPEVSAASPTARPAPAAPVPPVISTAVAKPAQSPVSSPAARSGRQPMVLAAIAAGVLMLLGFVGWRVMSRPSEPAKVAKTPVEKPDIPQEPTGEPPTDPGVPAKPEPQPEPRPDPATPAVASSSSTVKVPGDAATLAKAIELCKEGGTVEIAGGTYRESIQLIKSISLVANPSAVLEHDKSNVIVASGPIKVTLRNLQIKNPSEDAKLPPDKSPALVMIVEGAEVHFDGCVLEGSSGDGISVVKKASALFSNTRIHDNRGYGVNVRDASRVEMSLSEVRKNGFSGISMMSAGSKGTLGNGTTVAENSRNGVEVGNGASLEGKGVTITQNHKSGLAMQSSGSKAVLDASCVFSSNGQHGIIASDAIRLTLSNSTCSENKEHGLYLTKGAAAEITSCHFKSNGVVGIYQDLGTSGTMRISRTDFHSHAEAGVVVGEGNGEVADCVFTANKMAILFGENAGGSATGNRIQPGPLEEVLILESPGKVRVENNTIDLP
jgi:serine/threonine protein kinase